MGSAPSKGLVPQSSTSPTSQQSLLVCDPPSAQGAAESISNNSSNKPSEILSWLYLGSKYHYLNSTGLKELGITHVLSLVGGRYPSDIPPDKFQIIPLSDFGTDNLEKKLPHCLKFISSFIIKKKIFPQIHAWLIINQFQLNSLTDQIHTPCCCKHTQRHGQGAW